MSDRNRTPALLEPYLQLPPELTSTLLTGTLACNASWLVTRFTAAALQHDSERTGVVIVSWMHEDAFWRQQIRRVFNIDLDKVIVGAAFGYVDRLAESLAFPARNAASELQHLETKITEALETCSSKCRGGRVLLVLDMPEMLLATRSDISVGQLNNLLLKLRMHPRTHSMLISSAADLVRTTDEQQKTTSLDTATAAFVIQQAHIARAIISVRELETGSARDVSGIIRITSNGQDNEIKELEKRYLVQRDGSVKIVE